jgi:hypothetical protein
VSKTSFETCKNPKERFFVDFTIDLFSIGRKYIVVSYTISLPPLIKFGEPESIL